MYYGVTINLKDYREFRSENPQFRLSAERVLLEWCLMHTCHLVKKQGIHEPFFEWIFDVQEPFEPIVQSEYRKNVKMRTCTRGVYSLPAREVYPLQACDLLAWSLNRYDSKKPRFDWNQIAGGFFAMEYFPYTYYDIKALRSVFDETGRYREGKTMPTSGFWGTSDVMQYWLDLFKKGTA